MRKKKKQKTRETEKANKMNNQEKLFLANPSLTQKQLNR